MSFTCKSCGLSFDTRSDLATHQAEERKLAGMAGNLSAKLTEDDSPTPNANGGEVAHVSELAAPPAQEMPLALAEKDNKLIIPYAYLDPKVKYAGSSYPIFVEAQGYKVADGLAVKPGAFKLRFIRGR